MVAAAVLDATLREPPLAAHPVRAAGRYLDAVEPMVPAAPPRPATVRGGLAWAAGMALAVTAGAAAERAIRRAPRVLRPAALGLALWPLLSCRLLLDEVAAVERALAVDLHAGRAAVARIVSRDVDALSEAGVRQAALESLGENLSDSVVAPLLWFAVGGLPAAAGYRFANTADAMWGYRSPRWRHAGRVAARADDLLNVLPARLTGLALAAPGVRRRDLARAARATASPNAGWSMAALALRLDIRLAKPGAYALHSDGRSPVAADTAAALRLVRRRAWAAVVGAAVVAGIRERATS